MVFVWFLSCHFIEIKHALTSHEDVKGWQIYDNYLKDKCFYVEKKGKINISSTPSLRPELTTNYHEFTRINDN